MIIDAKKKSVQVIVICCGPEGSGKSTFLNRLFSHFGFSLDPMDANCLPLQPRYLDLGISLHNEKGWLLSVRFYEVSKGNLGKIPPADGIIIVLDSREPMRNKNLEAWESLTSHYGEQLAEIPIVLALNKQDELRKFAKQPFLDELGFLAKDNRFIVNSIALNGEGVLFSFEKLLEGILGRDYGVEFVFSR